MNRVPRVLAQISWARRQRRLECRSTQLPSRRPCSNCSGLGCSAAAAVSCGASSGAGSRAISSPESSPSSAGPDGRVSSKPASSSSCGASQGWPAALALRCSGVAGRISLMSGASASATSRGAVSDSSASRRLRTRRSLSTGRCSFSMVLKNASVSRGSWPSEARPVCSLASMPGIMSISCPGRLSVTWGLTLHSRSLTSEP